MPKKMNITQLKDLVIRADKSGRVELRCTCGSTEFFTNHNVVDHIYKKLFAHSLFMKCLGCGDLTTRYVECTGEDKCRWCRDLNTPED
jgi:hypothetical protein